MYCCAYVCSVSYIVAHVHKLAGTREELMVSSHVFFQITRCNKTLLANIAFVRLLSRVSAHVAFQITSFTETLLANVAFVRLLSSVSAHVFFQITRLNKTLLANVAFVRFLSSVSAHVDLQMTRFPKSLLANITFIRLLSSVDAHVSLQTTSCRKSLLANTTFVRPLPLRCSCRKSSALFVSYLLIFFRFFVRYFHAQHQLFFFFFFFSPLSATTHHDRLRVDRPLRIRALPSHLCPLVTDKVVIMVETEVLFDDKYRARASKNEGKITTFSSSLFPNLLRARPDAAHTHTYTFKKHDLDHLDHVSFSELLRAFRCERSRPLAQLARERNVVVFVDFSAATKKQTPKTVATARRE